MSKITNLKEFLSWRGFGEDEAAYWSRCFYKYTDCGPWVVFLMRDQPASQEEQPELVARLRKRGGQAVLENPDELDDNFVRFLGFDPQGLSKKERRWETYIDLVNKFIEEEKSTSNARDLEIISIAEDAMRLRRPAFTTEHPETFREIYYEDIRSGKESLDVDLCAGIKFGSIVEGSDATSGPFEHMFPIDKKAFDRDIEYMGKETSFYWKRDNGSWYVVCCEESDEEWHALNCWGDIEWEGETPPDHIKSAAEEAITNDWQGEEGTPFVRQTIPQMPGIYAKAKPGWKPMSLGETGAQIYTYINDEIF